CLKQRPPHRTVPLVLEMGEPGAGHHQWWPLAAHGVGNFHAVSALAVTDPLFHVRTRGCGIRTILLRCGGSARRNSGGARARRKEEANPIECKIPPSAFRLLPRSSGIEAEGERRVPIKNAAAARHFS